MIRSTACFAGALLALVACASGQVPAQRMADAEAASRAAEEIGASAHPQAQLHLRLAQEEIARAKQFIASGDNDRAASVLLRARADGDLALELAREAQAEAEEARAAAKVPARDGTNATTTTGAEVPAPAATPAPK
jgi:hypothetical protein